MRILRTMASTNRTPRLSLLVIGILFSTFFVYAQSGRQEFREGEVGLFEVKGISPEDFQNYDLRVKVFNLEFPLFKWEGSDGNYFSLLSPPLGVIDGKFQPTLVYNQKPTPSSGVSNDTKTRSSKTLTSSIPLASIIVRTRGNVLTDEVLNTPELNVLPVDPKTVGRVANEDALQKQILMSLSAERLWSGPFILPVQNEITSQFGLFRIYSKHLRRRTHWGVDFKTPLDTPVLASGGGVIVLAKDLYFPGKTIIIDHGKGLFTGYSHLNTLKVKVGDRINKGEVIGLSGRSGKVTGLHLHWFAVNGRVKFDPLTLLKLDQEANRTISSLQEN